MPFEVSSGLQYQDAIAVKSSVGVGVVRWLINVWSGGVQVVRLSCKECATYPIPLINRSYFTALIHGPASVKSSVGVILFA